MASWSKKRALTATVTNVARLLLAAVLIVSGFVKAVDPMGLSYKLQEYLAAFGVTSISDGWIEFGALILSAAEFVMGVLLLMGVYVNTITLLTFITFLLFTPFTLLLAYWNPVRDCGCFGDAIQMSNWATFGKNIVLLMCATLAWFKRRLFVRRVSMQNRWMVSLFAICYIAVVEGVSLSHLPVIDFRPFAVGSNLREAVDGTPSEYKTVLRFEKEGEVLEVEPGEEPDSTWNYLGSRSEVIKEGEPALIADFAFIDMTSGEDYAPSILEDTGYVCLVIIDRIETADESRVDRINEMYDHSREIGAKFYAATSSSEEEADIWRKHTGAEYPIVWADEVMLKTIVRSNPGMILIKDGTVTGKWNVTDLPSVEYFRSSPTAMPDRMPSVYTYIRGWKMWLILFAAPLLFIMFVDVVSSASRRRSKRIAEAKEREMKEKEAAKAMQEVENIEGISDNIETEDKRDS